MRLTNSLESTIRMLAVSLVSLLILANVISTIDAVDLRTLPELIDDGDCCKLELKNLIDVRGRKKFIPSSAIPALSENGLETYFFIKEIPFDKFHTHVGAINNTAKGFAFNWANESYSNWTTGAVLSNPNQCVLGWNVTKLPLVDTNKWSYPKLVSFKGPHFFGRYKSFIGATYGENGNHLNGVSMVDEKVQNINSDFELLYVDCAASIKSQLSSELLDIDMDRGDLLKQSGDGEVVVSSTDVTNNSDEDQMMKIDLDAEIFSSLEMTQNTKLFDFSQTKWGFHVDTSNLGWLGKIGLSINGGHDSEEVKKNFTRMGYVSVQSKRTAYKLNQEIKVKARTKTQVFIKTKPIRGNTHFTAYYKMSPRISVDMWTNDRVLSSIQRTGFEDWEKIITKNGSLIVPVTGHLSVESGFDTKAEIISTPLDSSQPKEVFKKVLLPTR